MIIVLPFSARDHQLARKLAHWMAELGPYPGHRALVIKDSRIDDHHEVAQTLRGCFDSVQEIPYPDDNRNTWPFSANRMFNRAAKEIEYSARPEAWLWLEPDVVPLRAGWLTELVTEYVQSGKPFMGDEVNVDDVPLHMSGVGFYPAQISNFAWEAPLAQDTAWDVGAAHQIVPKAHFTTRIVHAWKHEPIDDQSKLDNLRGQHAEMLLFHSDKSGAMIDLLRAEMLPVAPVEKMQQDQVEEMPLASGGQPTFDIFIKTYPADYPWLQLSLQAIHRYVTGFGKVIVVAPDDKAPVGSAEELLVKPEYDKGDGYLGQQVAKLYADMESRADYILHVDSDVLFTRTTSLQDFIGNGKVRWYFTPYVLTATPWQPITEKFLKRKVGYEFMRRAPQLIPRWLYPKLRQYCYVQHGKALSNYVLDQPYREFSEFNALGAYAWEFHKAEFTWLNTGNGELPPASARQFRSWDGIGAYRAEIDKILPEEFESKVLRQAQEMDKIVPLDLRADEGDGSVPRRRRRNKMTRKGRAWNPQQRAAARARAAQQWTPEKREAAKQRAIERGLGKKTQTVP